MVYNSFNENANLHHAFSKKKYKKEKKKKTNKTIRNKRKIKVKLYAKFKQRKGLTTDS